MSKYSDVYLLPISEENIPAYKKLATAAGKLFLKNGALKYREYVASDLNTEDVIPFPKVVKLKPGETLVYASVEFSSEAHRNKVMKKVMADPEMTAMMPKKARNRSSITNVSFTAGSRCSSIFNGRKHST